MRQQSVFRVKRRGNETAVFEAAREAWKYKDYTHGRIGTTYFSFRNPVPVTVTVIMMGWEVFGKEIIAFDSKVEVRRKIVINPEF